jgi:hypothetical protein
VSRERTVKKLFKNATERENSVAKPIKKWLTEVENDLKNMNVRGWRKIAKGRDV